MVYRIYNEAEIIIKRYKTRCPYELADSLGIIVMFRDLDELKGFYLIENKSRYIVINNSLDEYLQKLICSHELGHDRLHRHFAAYDSLRDYSLFDISGKIEREANLFASDLLISDTEMMLYFKWSNYTYDQISRMMYVPEALVRFKAYSVSKRGYDVRTPELAKSNFLKDF